MVLYELVIYKCYVRSKTNHYIVVRQYSKLVKTSMKIREGTFNENQIRIFGTSKGVNVVESPIKAKILNYLDEEERTGAELVELTGKSKATISVHLHDLIDMGIVDFKPNPKDKRSKIFYIKSSYIGGLSKNKDFNKQMDSFITDNIVKSADPFEFFRFVFRTIRVSLMEEGFNIDPILHNAGVKVGLTYYEKLKNDEIEVLIDNLSKFWKKNKLGRIKIENIDPLTLRAYDCFECEDLPKIGRSACAFDSGILEAVFSAHYSSEVEVDEVKCYAKGDDYCSFIVKKPSKKN